MKTVYNFEEFRTLHGFIGLAIGAVQERIDALKKELEAHREAKAGEKAMWWQRITYSEEFDLKAMRLQIDISVREDRRDALLEAIRVVQLAINSNAEQVILGNQESKFLEMYTR